MRKPFKTVVGLSLFLILSTGNIGFAFPQSQMKSIPKGCLIMGSVDEPDDEKPFLFSEYVLFVF